MHDEILLHLLYERAYAQNMCNQLKTNQPT